MSESSPFADVPNLSDLVTERLEEARTKSSGRATSMLVSKPPLRQMLIALGGGAELAEHNSPKAASLLIIAGSIDFRSESGHVTANVGDVLTIPDERHSVLALEDAAFILTTVTE